MADTYSRIYIQIIFAVRNRYALIQPSWEHQLYKYITGIIKNKGQKLLSINGTSNHIHILISMKPTCCLSDLVREIKKSSDNFISENHFTRYHFTWQDGFGAFSCHHSDLTNVIRYIDKQKEHHQKIAFRDEYIDFMEKQEIELKNEYFFEWIE